jgi:integrase
VKLWILLALNCGFTQTDISSLAPDMVDWQHGIIARDRQKTGVDSQHKLWPITLKTLREQAGAGPLLLTRKDGQPLVREEIKEDGKPSKTDMVAHTFAALKEKSGGTLSFKYFRKTGANAIAKQFQDKPWLVELYLAHSDPRMRKHYPAPSGSGQMTLARNVICSVLIRSPTN